MEKYNLKILNNDLKSIEIKLSDERIDIFGDEEVNSYIEDDYFLYPNKEYSFQIIPKIPDVKEGYLYINSAQPLLNENTGEKAYEFNVQTSTFSAVKGSLFHVFFDAWGYVNFKFKFILKNGEIIELYSKYVGINSKNDGLEGMASVIHNFYPELLFKNGVLSSVIKSGLENYSEGPLEGRIGLIKKIIRLYDNQFNFFMTNARTSIKPTFMVDRFEKINKITSESIEYVVQHPNTLYKVANGKGIHIKKSTYHPREILMEKNIISYNIYENQIIVDFLFVITKKIEEIETILLGLTSGKKSSFKAIFQNLYKKEYLESILPIVHELNEKAKVLLQKYSKALKLKPKNKIKFLRATNIFIMVPQYRKVFDYILKWQTSTYDFDQDKYLLFAIGSSKLYETFVLIAMLKYLLNEGYVIEGENIHYNELEKSNNDIKCNNVFCCQKERDRFTIYYQPVISANKSGKYGIDLRRRDSKDDNNYYTPDYIIKKEKEGVFNAKYIILDAKFGNYDDVEREGFKAVERKYLEGVESINNAVIANVWTIYGKYSNEDPIVTVRGLTKEYKGNVVVVSPNIGLVPLSYEILENDNGLFLKTMNHIFDTSGKMNIK